MLGNELVKFLELLPVMKDLVHLEFDQKLPFTWNVDMMNKTYLCGTSRSCSQKH